MNELIQIANRQIGDGAIQTVNARELHIFLEVGKDFSTWIKDRIAQYGFVEHHDYVTAQELSAPKSGSTMARAQRTVAYYLSLDMAKELAMVERNEKGKQARQYFIECERRAKQAALPQHVIPQSLPEALRLAADLADQKNQAEAKLAIVAPKADALDRLATHTVGSFCLRDAAKNLQVQEKRFIQYLVEHDWIYRRPGGSSWMAYAGKIQNGLLEHKVTTGEKSDGSEWANTQVRVTARGMAKLAMVFSQSSFPFNGVAKPVPDSAALAGAGIMQ